MITYFTSESVTDGHPDKICDQIADTILDAALAVDPNSHMAVEATIKDNFILVYGEANTKANLDYEELAKAVLKKIGYTEDYEVLVKVSTQSSEINQAVIHSETAAGDQGIMFGYACDETPELMPLPIMLAHKLAKRLSDLKQKYTFLKPDGKSQVTVAYEDGKPLYVSSIIVSAQHEAQIEQSTLRELIINEVINEVIPSSYLTDDTIILVNPSGSFVLGGPFGDSGTTGRKIVVDTYGGMSRIGGGCFSSKDPSKVDRSAAYYARYVAKNIVARKLASKCEIQLSYAIGVSEPISVFIETFGTETTSIKEIMQFIAKNFNFNVRSMIDELQLKRPIYAKTAAFGHFGREEFSWEKIKTTD